MFEPTESLTSPMQFVPTKPFRNSSADPSAIAGLDFDVSSTLSASVRSDLSRFGNELDAIELLPALAASVRHGQSLAMLLKRGGSVLLASVFPTAQLYQCEVDLHALMPCELEQLRLVRIDAELAASPTGIEGSSMNPPRVAPLRPLLWQIAEYGARTDLLPEIAGDVRYRLAPGFSTCDLPVEPSAMPLLRRLRTSTASFQDLSAWTVRGPARVCRLLNALYLQAALMVLRTSPKSELPKSQHE